jgi:hypothetical protein
MGAPGFRPAFPTATPISANTISPLALVSQSPEPLTKAAKMGSTDRHECGFATIFLTV